MKRQVTNKAFTVRPRGFGFNPETAATNPYQHEVDLQGEALELEIWREYASFYRRIRNHGVYTIEDLNSSKDTPDAIFPNNWFSTHDNELMILYPMMAENRRKEIRPDLLEFLHEYYEIPEIWDLRKEARDDEYLEGTGSMIFDRAHQKVYACRSARTNERLVKLVAERLSYEAIIFDAVGSDGNEVYHSNILLSISDKLAICCLEAITDEQQREQVKSSLVGDGLHLMEISIAQMENFCANAIVMDGDHGHWIFMSKRAYEALDPEQQEYLESNLQVLELDVEYIEKIGGGSVRCMIAEMFLKPKLFDPDEQK